METEIVNIPEVKQKLILKLEGTGWFEKLRLFLRSSDFNILLEKLAEDREKGYRFTPPLAVVFRPFQLCHYKDTRVVFLVDEPHIFTARADGLCFSSAGTSHRKTFSNILAYIFKEIKKTVYPEQEYKNNQDLSRWAMQGILMLNCTLTTRMRIHKKHIEIWRPFMNYLIEVLNQMSDEIIFVFFGEADEWADNITGNKRKFFVSHPDKTIPFEKTKNWDSRGIFNKINLILKENGKSEIKW